MREPSRGGRGDRQIGESSCGVVHGGDGGCVHGGMHVHGRRGTRRFFDGRGKRYVAERRDASDDDGFGDRPGSPDRHRHDESRIVDDLVTEQHAATIDQLTDAE